jgi:rhombotail lipoprotein
LPLVTLNIEEGAMRIRTIIALTALGAVLSGCMAVDQIFCAPHCRSETRNSSSLVSFLYPDGSSPPLEDAIPELHLPLRVGLAFLPSQHGGGANSRRRKRNKFSNAFARALRIGSSSLKS